MNNEQTSADRVAAHVLRRDRVWGHMHLQKLVYYAQAWTITWEGRPLFPERVEAWTLGPVVPPLYGALKHEQRVRDDSPLPEHEAAIVDAVLDYYAGSTGTDLSKLTHQEAPWLDARSGLPDGARSDREISHSSMRRYYTTEAMIGRAPRRPVGDFFGNPSQVLEVGRSEISRWEKTLEILAR